MSKEERTENASTQMPKTQDTEEILEEIKELCAAGSGRHQRQIVTRIENELAVKFYQECVDKGETPADRLRDMINFYYRIKETGLTLALTKHQTEIVSLLARITTTEPENAVKHLIQKYGIIELNALHSALDDQPGS